MRRRSRSAVTIAFVLFTLGNVGALAADVCIRPGEPAAGQAGTRVTIAGTNLLGSFGGAEIT